VLYETSFIPVFLYDHNEAYNGNCLASLFAGYKGKTVDFEKITLATELPL